MQFNPNQAFLRTFLKNPEGSVGQYVKSRADNVEERARENASFGVIGIVSGALLDGISTQPSQRSDGEVAYVVGSDAVAQSANGSFSYPGYHNSQTNRPWLTLALSEEFQ